MPQHRVFRQAAPVLALVLLLVGCQPGPAPIASQMAANSVLSDLHLTAVPPPLPPPAHQAVPVPLGEPLVIRHLGKGPATAAPLRETGGEGTITLNFDKASLRSVIDAVLGDALGVPYSVDERVDGVVTLVSPGKLTREQALDTLEGVLRMNGAALIKGERLYRVVLAANARQSLPGPERVDQPGYAASIYVPSHSAAPAIQKLIEPLYQIAGAVASDSEHNLLVITGSAEERRALLDAARLFDQDWLASQSIGLFPLHQAQPRQVVGELKTLFAGAAGQEAALVKFSAVDRLDAVLVVALDAGALDRAADWISRLDKAGPGERTLHVYPVRYAKTAKLAKLLGGLFSGSGAEAAVETGNAALPPGMAGARISTQATGGGQPPVGVTQGQGTGFASSDHPLGQQGEAAADTNPDSGKGARIIADPASNTLLAMANQAEARMIEEALASLDARPAQILIEATIVEVALNKNLQFGVQYFLRGTKFAGQADSSVGFTGANALGVIQGLAPGFNGVIGKLSNPSVILSALDAVTESKVLSSPQLLVTDSHEAVLKVGTQTPLLTQQAISVATGTAPIVNNVEYHDTGVILRVLPRANEADMVSLEIAQEVSQVVPNAANPLTPDIDERRIESAVSVQSGQTVMLGGLISENNSLTRDGLPGLSSLPLVGPLFGTNGDSRNRTELVVFITPHILRDNEAAQRLTEELTSRLRSMRP